MTLRIREAEPADDAGVGELLVRAFLERYRRKLPEVALTPARLAALRDVAGKRALGTVWVAELDGALAGTVSLLAPGAPTSRAWLPGAAELKHLAVDLRCQGRGVAGALMDTAEGRARALGASAVCLHSRREAVGVVRVYQRRGYLRQPMADLDLLPEVYLVALALPLEAPARLA